MGASDWDYWVPYDEDVESAFQRLREDVFRRGEFYRLADDELGDFDDEPPTTNEPYATIEDLVERNQEAGTHSILDMQQIADIPANGAVTRLSAAEMQSMFGSETPTRARIEERKNQLVTLDAFAQASRTGVYVVAYRDGEPDELYFYGISGD